MFHIYIRRLVIALSFILLIAAAIFALTAG